MLETLARLDFQRAGFVCFVTLTYPDRDGPPSAETSERDRCTFLKRIRRRYPIASALWRREWEPRESGEFIGVGYPHYHLLCFGLPFVPYEVVNEWWRETLDYDGYVRTEIKAIQQWRKAVYYVAKYMAKVPASKAAGDGPGTVREVPDQPGGEAASSLVYSTKVTGDSGGTEEEAVAPAGTPIGRSWGIFNRKDLPFAECKTVRVEPGEWLSQAKEMAQCVWSRVGEYSNCGFTLFVDDPDQWLAVLQQLQQGDQEGGAE